jgi:hypothetical protein
MRILMIGTAFACIFAFNPAVAGPFESGAATFDTEATLLLLAGGKGKGGNVLGHGHGNAGVLLPPGQAKKWARGQYLPKAIVWTPAPAVIVAKLKPVPPGHKYVVIDGEVLLVALATGLILDVLDVI